VETRRQQLTRWRFTVHDYHRMGEAGILHEDDRVELIEGELVEMTAIGTRHFSCVNRLNRLLVMNVGDEAIVSVQNPVRLNEYNEPQPDLAVIRPRDYRESYRIRLNGARNLMPPPPAATNGSSLGP
jgi:Uma2 family endonuclease